MPNARILVADDDPSILGTLVWVLKEQGYDVISARDGRTLIDQLEQRSPDLVLLDVMFPDADGYQNYRSSGPFVYTVRVNTSFTYAGTSLLAYLGLAPITLTGAHEERYIGW